MPTRSTTALALLALLAFFGGAAAAEDWPSLHRDAARSGVSAEPFAPHDLAIAWAVAVDEESVDASPAVVGGRVYVGTASGKVVCLTAEAGARVWETRVGGAVVSSPAVAEGRVFVGSADRCLYALEAATGRVLWRVRTRRPVVASPLWLEGRVYCGSGDGVFRCVKAETGEVLWEAREAGEISGAAAGAAGVVYYGDEEGNVTARNCADGKALWTVKLGGQVVAAPLLAAGKLVVPLMEATALQPRRIPCISVLDPATGTVVWALQRESSILQTPVADTENLYFAAVSGYLSDTELLACRLADGAELWKLRLGGVADSSPLLAGKYLMFGNHDSSFYVVDKTAGTPAQVLALGGRIFSSPALSNGAIYVGVQGGKVVCLK